MYSDGPERVGLAATRLATLDALTMVAFCDFPRDSSDGRLDVEAYPSARVYVSARSSSMVFRSIDPVDYHCFVPGCFCSLSMRVPLLPLVCCSYRMASDPACRLAKVRRHKCCCSCILLLCCPGISTMYEWLTADAKMALYCY